MITVFFDGKCGLCRREISFYRRHAPDAPITWIDVMGPEFRPELFSLSRDAALRAIHVRNDDGQWRTGADAFSLIWKALPGFRWLGVLVSSPWILPAARGIYKAFGYLRYRLHGYDRCAL